METSIDHFVYPQKMAHEIGNDAYERNFLEKV